MWVKGRDTGVKSLSQENSAAKMDEDRRQTCESAANLCKPQLHWSMFHPCCEKWSRSLVWGQRHVHWPFVDLEKPQEQMCLFFIFWCLFSSEVQDAADPISPMIRTKFCFYFIINIVLESVDALWLFRADGENVSTSLYRRFQIINSPTIEVPSALKAPLLCRFWLCEARWQRVHMSTVYDL